jgi:TolB-like protein/Flp pilus assembly protein TadD
LRQALVELGRAFDAIQLSALIKRQDTIAIDPAAVEVDVLRFEQLAASNDPEDLRAAADFFTGDLLEGIGIRDPAFEEWLSMERQRVRSLALTALRRLLAMETGQGALNVAQRLLALDPLQEESHRALMRIHAEAGEIGLALRQYELCRDTLRRELHVAPSPETEALHREIRLRSDEQLKQRGPESHPAETPVQQRLFGDATQSKPLIAVLPFKNLSGDPAQQVVSDCITEDVATELSRFRSLKVIGRHSSFGEQFLDAREVGRELDVDYVVDGTVLKTGDQIRITARLSETGSGAQLWAERYVRELQDAFAVQDEVARTIVSTLSGRVEDAGAERARRKHAGSLAAYDCLYRAIELHNRMTDEDEPRAREMLLKALDLDPEFALAYAWLAVSYMVDWFEFGSREAFEKALSLARRAVVLDDDDGRCHSTLGYLSIYHKLFEQAVFHAERAVALTPNDCRVICGRGMVLAYLGRPAEAIEWFSSAFRLNPYPPEWYGPCKGMVLFSARRYAEAVAALEGSSHSCALWSGMYLAASLERLGRRDEARSILVDALAKRPALRSLPYASNEPYKNPADLQHLLDALRQVAPAEIRS